MGIPTAGIRQNKNRTANQGLGLQPKADSSGPVFWEQRSIDRDTEQGDRVRAIALYFGSKPLPSGVIFTQLEYIDPCAGPLNDVCQAEPPIRKTPIVLVRERLGHKLRLEQEFPETVRVPSEVMSNSG